jgi:hypothetical protein
MEQICKRMEQICKRTEQVCKRMRKIVQEAKPIVLIVSTNVFVSQTRGVDVVKMFSGVGAIFPMTDTIGG